MIVSDATRAALAEIIEDYTEAHPIHQPTSAIFTGAVTAFALVEIAERLGEIADAWGKRPVIVKQTSGPHPLRGGA